MKITAIVLAGGRGSRMKSDVPKQYMNLLGKPLIYYALQAFENSQVDEIILVAGAEDIDFCRSEIVEKYGITKVKNIVCGGSERYFSVKNGLDAVCGLDDDIILIHDGARPNLTDYIINACIEDACLYGACVAAVPAKDTIKVSDDNGFAKETPDRSKMWMVQTPQGFRAKLVKDAYEKMVHDDNRGNITDDAMVVEKYSSVCVKLTMSEYTNIKVTTPEDMDIVALQKK